MIIQRDAGPNGWVDVTSENFNAKASTKNYKAKHSFSDYTGPFRILIQTYNAHGVKMRETWITADQTWLLWTFVIGWAAISITLEQTYITNGNISW